MKIGPIMFDLIALEMSEEEQELLLHPLVGGIILFTRNYFNREQLSRLIESIRILRTDLLIAVDQEGGRVQRFREGFTRLPPPAEFGQLGEQSLELAKQQAKSSAIVMAKELREIGIDFSFAPVLDVDRGISKVIGDRSFSQDVNLVIELAGAYIDGMHQVAMPAVGKHFPGHGAVVADSHLEIPIDYRDFSAIFDTDMLPFRVLSPKLQAIMPAHIIFSNVDNTPVGFSQFWLQQVLRRQLQFDGAIISDDLSMQGASFIGGYLQRAEVALEAGCDMVLICNNRSGAIEVLDNLKYQFDPVSERRLQAMHAYQAQ